MASAGLELMNRIPELVGRIFDEHFEDCECHPREGARERVMAQAEKQAAWLGQVIEAEEVQHLDPSDPYGKQEP
jgi:hypothetical protein